MKLFTIHLNDKCVGIIPKIVDENNTPKLLNAFVGDLFNNLGYQSYSEYLGDLPGRNDLEELFIKYSEGNPECTYFFGGETLYKSNKLHIAFHTVWAYRFERDPVIGFTRCNYTSSLPDIIDPDKNGGECCMFLTQPTKELCKGAGAESNHELWFCSDWDEDDDNEPKPIPHKSIYSNYKIQMDYDPNPDMSRQAVSNMIIGLTGFFSPIVWSIVFRLLR